MIAQSAIKYLSLILFLANVTVSASPTPSSSGCEPTLCERDTHVMRHRMGFAGTAEVIGAHAPSVVILDTSEGNHMAQVLSAFSQTDASSRIFNAELSDLQGRGIADFFDIFVNEKFTIVNISITGYCGESHDFALLYALARHFPDAHFVLAIGNKGMSPRGYPYPQASKEMLDRVKHQLTFAIWSQRDAHQQEEFVSTSSMAPKDFDMRAFYEERSLVAPGELGEMGGSSFAALRIAGCISRLCQVYGLASNDAAGLLLETAKKPRNPHVYEPGKHGRGYVDYARAAAFVMQNALPSPHPLPQETAPDYDAFCHNYHIFQWVAAARNTSNYVMTFGYPVSHFMTSRQIFEGANESFEVAGSDAVQTLQEVEEIYQKKHCSFKGFANALVRAPLGKLYPGCATYLFLSHIQGASPGIVNEFMPYVCEAQTDEDILELCMMTHKKADLSMLSTCLDDLGVQGAMCDVQGALLGDKQEVPVYARLLQCMGVYDFFNTYKIESVLLDMEMRAKGKWGWDLGADVMNAMMQKAEAHLRTRPLGAKSQGNPFFFITLGMCHETGRFGFEVDTDLASHWYEKVLACQGAPASLRGITKMRLGECQAQNTRRAFAFFGRVAEPL
ncbi:MAG: hypothetical protein LCH26_07480 [Proteobacteria bacterium]|nr:hypothetical protein [Pseudomonadota bacterium]